MCLVSDSTGLSHWSLFAECEDIMKLSLLVMTPGKQQGKSLEIKTPQFLVGRDPQCQLRPASPLISKRHCALLIREGKAFIRDFGSTNGTYVNGERVQGERELHHDDLLKIGPLEFTIRLEKTVTAINKPTPAPATKPATPKPANKAATSAPARPEASVAEDEALMMLLEGDDETPRSSVESSDGIPEGSTVLDLQVPPEVLAAVPGQPAKPAAPPPKKPEEGDTRSAAASILEKMMRRPRNT
jgi:pSer/pThr/pTyr-binding forkhead associated (FHA) protein